MPQEAPQVHRPCTAIGVIGIDVTNQVGGEINQRHDMTAGTGGGAAQADRRSQFLVDGVVEDAAAAVAWILDAIANAGIQQRVFQTARTARTGMTIGEAVNRFQTVVAGQRLQTHQPQRPGG